jgi:glycosyltransferase involved in cell wall biosynthesis
VVSILILTLNEETNLSACLESVSWSDDIVIFDSHSTDRTVEIANAAGASVVQRKFDSYGAQREAARQVKYKYPWVLALDADERPDKELVSEIRTVVRNSDTGEAAYRMRRKDHFMGQWVKHATLYPSWFIRLYRPDKIRYEARTVHEYPTVQGPVGELKGHLIHFNFSKGLNEWVARHNRYAEMEAQENLKSLRNGRLDFGGLFSASDPVRRRRALKELSFRLPCRPTLRFLYLYLLRMGILDGRPGLTYCRLLAMYERTIVLKMAELERREKGLPI